MVVLDANLMMPSTSANQYLSPDYLPPLSSSLDSKNSPLALLAQTCSQIGADTSNTKSLLSDRSKKSERVTPVVNGNNSKLYGERKTPETKLAFKPYELNVLSKKTERPVSNSTDGSSEDRKSASRTSSRKSASASPHNSSSNNSAEKPSSPSGGGATARTSSKSSSPSSGGDSNSASRLNIDMSAAGVNSYKPSSGFPLSPLGNLGCTGCPTSLDPTNPAFRSPFPMGSHFPHPSLLDAFHQSSTPSSFLNYTRVKTPSGGEAIVPVCKDPYCFSCRFSMHGTMGAPCPPGCVQCDPKYNAAAAAAAAASLMSHPLYQYGRPFACNWISGDSYCGKRFRSSDELFQHLRTHTNVNDALAFMNQFRYPPTTSSLSSLAAVASSRYHPYSKPSSISALGASPYGAAAFNPALNPYYSPYSFYDQRIGAAVNP